MMREAIKYIEDNIKRENKRDLMISNLRVILKYIEDAEDK